MTLTTAARTIFAPLTAPRRLTLAAGAFFVVAAVACFPHTARAQEPETRPASAAGLLKKVALDPTTYAAAALSYDATMRDWNTSQVFFANGFREWNERFTASGRPNDVAVSYAEGRHRILRDSLVTLEISALNNFATHAVEGLLVNRYPTHRRLIKTIALVDRMVSASYMSYRLSAGHYQQARYNASLAQSLGYR